VAPGVTAGWVIVAGLSAGWVIGAAVLAGVVAGIVAGATVGRANVAGGGVLKAGGEEPGVPGPHAAATNASSAVAVNVNIFIVRLAFARGAFRGRKRHARRAIGAIAKCAKTPSSADSCGAYCRGRPPKGSSRIEQKSYAVSAAPAADVLTSP